MKKRVLSILVLLGLLLLIFVSCDDDLGNGGKESETPGSTVSEIDGEESKTTGGAVSGLDGEESETPGGAISELDKRYDEALRLIENGDCEGAYAIFDELGDYKDAKVILKDFKYAPTRLAYGEINVGYSIEMSYNKLGCLTQAAFISPDGVLYTYDYAYDENGNMIRESNDVDGFWYMNYIYDENGRLIQEVNDNGVFMEYTYDENGNMIRKVETRRDEGATTYDYAYDESGNMIRETTTTADGRVWTDKYTYDENRRLVREDTQHGEYYEFTYDESGNLTKKVYAGSDKVYQTEDFVYNENNQILKETLTDRDGNVDVTDYTYDEYGRLTREAYVKHTGYTSIYEKTYDENGNMIRMTCGDDISLDYTYDENGCPIRLVHHQRGGVTEINAEYRFIYMPYELPEEVEEFLGNLLYIDN